MSKATLTTAGKRRWALNGVLDFYTVPALWPALEKLLKVDDALTLSLAKVSQTNSAGLVLLIEAIDLARRTHCRLKLVDLPAELLDLARMSRCESLITNNTA